MQNLTIDTGMQEYLINNRAVLRFNPSDPNLYHRFFAAAPKLDALDAELTEQLKALPAKPDDARAERGLALLTDYDHRIKALLTEIFGGENDFDQGAGGRQPWRAPAPTASALCRTFWTHSRRFCRTARPNTCKLPPPTPGQKPTPPARRGSRHDPEPVDAARDRTLC